MISSEKFAKTLYLEKENFIKEYLSEESETEVRRLIESLNLSTDKTMIMEKVLDQTITDVLYTLLLGLSGCASIGGVQQSYELKDEKGNQMISDETEGFAYKYFIESD